MSKQILWQTQITASGNEQLIAGTNFIRENNYTNRDNLRKKILLFLLVTLNIIFYVILKFSTEGYIFFKMIGMNIGFFLLLRLWVSLLGKKEQNPTNQQTKSKDSFDNNNVYIKEDGVYCGEIFYAWKDIIQYEIQDEWLFVMNTETVLSIKIAHLSADNLTSLQQILKERIIPSNKL